jgi:hypothetical protein
MNFMVFIGVFVARIHQKPKGVCRPHHKLSKKKASSNGCPLWVSAALSVSHWISGIKKKEIKEKGCESKKVGRHYKCYWGRTKEEKQASYNRAFQARRIHLQQQQNQCQQPKKIRPIQIFIIIIREALNLSVHRFYQLDY